MKNKYQKVIGGKMNVAKWQSFLQARAEIGIENVQSSNAFNHNNSKGITQPAAHNNWR